jgi:cytochrome c-type biogenesis protein CcmH/NrfG
MLFDLRARGRRNMVKVIYLFLAVLMGGGLIFFGIGGNTSGGLLDAFKGSNQSTSTSDIFQKRLESAEKRTQANPQDAAAWAELARVRYQVAGTGGGYDQNTGAFTDSGKNELRSAETAWDRYLTLTKKPDDTVASLMVQAFGPQGLNKPDKAVNALEIMIDNRTPTPQLYVQLAALAYEAKQTRKAELASAKALKLAPKDDREQIKAQLQSARAAVSAVADPSSVTGGTATTTTPSG